MTEQAREPLYIRILVGAGAWAAALFALACLGVADLLEEGAAITGILFLAAGVAAARLTTATFFQQLALALAFSGNLTVLWGMADSAGYENTALSLMVTQAVVCAAMYPLFPNVVYRFAAPIGLVTLVVVWMAKASMFTMMHVLVGAVTILAGWLLSGGERRDSLRPLKYSSATMLPATLLYMNLTVAFSWNRDFTGPLWPSNVVPAAALIILLVRLAGGWQKIREPWLLLAILCTALLGTFTTPGVLVVVGLLVLGFAHRDAFLSGLGFLFLPCFLVLFYYALNVDLAYKSYVVTGSGALFLVVRRIAYYCRPREVVS